MGNASEGTGSVKKRRLPTLRAVGPDDEPEGFTVAQVDVTDLDTWHVETDGMRASDIGDTMTSESLAKLFAAAPDLLAVGQRLLRMLPHGDEKELFDAACALEAAVHKALGKP